MSDYHGLPTGTLGNDHLRLEYLAEAGPRLVRLFVNGSATGENLLAEVPELVWSTPLGPYRVQGGHRLWHAPEAMPRTYVPDDRGLTVKDLSNGVELRQPTEAATGLRKTLIIQLQPDRAALTLTHSLTNEALWPVETAPWAITQLRLGGRVVLPQPDEAAGSDEINYRFRPNRHLVLWPYAHWDDPRLTVHNDVVLFQAQPRLPPCKLGYLNTHGWAGYLHEGLLFVKQFQPQPTAIHPDWNCNVEVFGNDRFVELETLAPLTRLEPGQSATHVEGWTFFTGVPSETTCADVQSLIRKMDPSPTF
jgi:hypothetical protein